MPRYGKVSEGNSHKQTQVFNIPFDEEEGFSVVAMTGNSKEVRVRRDEKGYYYVVFNPGGQLPKALNQKFTGYEQALAAVTRYYAN